MKLQGVSLKHTFCFLFNIFFNNFKFQSITKVIDLFSHLQFKIMGNMIDKKNIIILKNSLVDRYNYNVIKNCKLITFITNPKYKDDLKDNNFEFNKNNMMKIISNKYVNKKLIKNFKQKLPQIDIIEILKNFEDSYSTSYVKQFILNVIFCITLQKHDGTAILYGKSILDKPLIDLLIICKQFYKHVYIQNNFEQYEQNHFILKNFDETKRDNVSILWKLYDTINDNKYVTQLLDFKYSTTFINKIITYDSKKYIYAYKFYSSFFINLLLKKI